MIDSDAPSAAPPPPAALVRSSYNRELVDSWALVLEALGIEWHVIADGPALHLLVAPADHARAEAALVAHDRERKAELEARPPPLPDGGRSAAGMAFAVAIAAFHWVTGPRAGADLGGWFRRGSSIADRVVGGETWRAVTALTLHADWGHVFGNAVAALVFVSALGRWLGGGLALAATVTAGTLGNLIVAFAYGGRHNSVGASTATFAALGLLGGLQALRWLRDGPAGIGRRRRVLSIIGACLGVFAMLGVGEKVDVLAHLAGLVVGLGFGFALGRLRLPARPMADVTAGLAAAVMIVGAWLAAFS